MMYRIFLEGRIMSAQTSKAAVMDHDLKWKPDAPEQTQLYKFMKEVEAETGKHFHGYHDFWRWSVENKDAFWNKVWDDCEVIGEKGKTVFAPGASFREGASSPTPKSTSRRTCCAAMTTKSPLSSTAKTR